MEQYGRWICCQGVFCTDSIFVFCDDPDNQMLRLLPDCSWLQPIDDLINVRILFYDR